MNIILNNIKIDPFESAFGIRSGLDDVKVNGQIHQAICNSFKIQQKINIPLLPNEQTLTLLVNKHCKNFLVLIISNLES